MAQIGVVPDHVIPTDIDEGVRKDELPRVYATRLAREKASAAAREGQFTLAADSIVAIGRRILPKAGDGREVRTCLGLLSGRRHHALTAVTLITPAGDRSERVVDTAVVFARLTAAQIDAYAAGGEGIGKAGGYAIQGRAASFVRLLSGSYSGVVGLPLFETAQLLRGRGYLVP